MTDYKKLCAELADRLQRAITSSKADRFYAEDRDALDRARAALAEGAGVGPFPADPVEAADAAELIATETGLELNIDAGMYLCSVHGVESIARRSRPLRRHPSPPIPVAERLPTVADCAPWPEEDDIEPWCWQLRYVDDVWEITQASRSRLNSPICADYTHWLPAAAIPLPEASP